MTAGGNYDPHGRCKMTEAAGGAKTSVAIVTGASRGIGRATAQALGDLGWMVALVARSEDKLRETAQSLNNSLAVVIDVSAPRAAETIVQRTLDQLGRIDALVNNAGVAPMLSVEQTTDEIWDDAIETNLS